MAKASAKRSDRSAQKSRLGKAAPRKAVAAKAKRRSIAEVNQWMTAHHVQLLEAARKNCVRLTGRPTFGGRRARESA
jgi:hypothetical protein